MDLAAIQLVRGAQSILPVAPTVLGVLGRRTPADQAPGYEPIAKC